MAEVAVTNLSKRFGRVEALKGVNLKVGEGSFVALMGPSGCGKTTLLRLIAGLESADSGTIRIGARDVGAMPAEKRDIGLMFQSYALFPHMTVAENLVFPMRMRRDYDAAERGRRIARALDLVRLPGIADRYPKQLSGGQQQRVAFARALIDEPSVLLLDEPLSNLDARLRDEMQIELVEMRRAVPITTIMVTHDQVEGLTLADEIVVMREGRIEQAGAPRKVYADPATAFVADFLGGANLVPVRIERAGGSLRGTAPDGTALALPASPRESGAATLMIRPERIGLLAPGEASEVTVEATVVASAYRGALTQISLEALGQRLSVVAPPGSAPLAGERVRIGWSLADARLVES